MGYKKGTTLYKSIKAQKDKSVYLTKVGLIAKAFPVSDKILHSNQLRLKGNLEDITEYFSSSSPKISPFLNAGVMINEVVTTGKVTPKYSGKKSVLGDILQSEPEILVDYYIPKDELDIWKKHKGKKNESRVTKDGFSYNYSEGAMIFPDALESASRTIVTGEGGKTPSRFKHAIEVIPGKPRRLTPLELERLNMFPDNHTAFYGISDTKRAFLMGNALVVGVIEQLGKALANHVKK